jgi:hypothetical protein
LVILASVAFSTTPAALGAQLARPSGVRAFSLDASGPVADTARRMSRLPARLGLAFLGGLGGLFGGAILAASLDLGIDCDCDDPGLSEAVTGGVVGVALSAALAAALPHATADCRYRARLWRGVAGATLGVAAGFLAPLDARLVTVPLGGIAGAALGAESCVWQKHN